MRRIFYKRILYLGYRTNDHQKFTRTLMYDDGTHGDGGSWDNVYGTSITVTTAETEYYIFAENINAGIFSPERAEHEFHVLNTNFLITYSNYGKI